MPTLFIDEVKGKSYRLVAVSVNNSEMARLRKVLRNQVLPGQRSVHFAKEQDQRRKAFLSTCRNLRFVAYEVDLGNGHEFDLRPLGLQKLVVLARELKAERLVLDLDESIRTSDELELSRAIRIDSPEFSIGFDHMQRHEEPLLWVADAIAWSINRGGTWLPLVEPMLRKFET